VTGQAGEGGPRDFRECGLALLDASEVYESAFVGYEAGKPTLAIIVLIARGRRLARSIFHLADAGDRLEAMILVRTLLEYRVTLRWLILNPELHLLQWERDDLKSRLRIDTEVRALGLEGISDAARARYEATLARVEADLGDRPRRFPSFRERTQAIGAEFVYSLIYRFDSQRAAHPSLLALEQLLEHRPEQGGTAVLSEPTSHGDVDPYAVTATSLLDMLEIGRAGLQPHLGKTSRR
jgi:Family of unknown function (DUF5677)